MVRQALSLVLSYRVKEFVLQFVIYFAGLLLGELENGIPHDGKFSTGHMEGEVTHDWDDAVYKHGQISVNLSEQKMDEHPGDHCGHSSSPNIIGIYLVPSAEYVVAILAVLRTGGAFLPIDSSWPKERVLAIPSMSKVRLVVSCHHIIYHMLPEKSRSHQRLLIPNPNRVFAQLENV